MFREWEEWSFGRSRRRGERLGRAQDETKGALQADKVETSKNYQGKIKSPALQNRGRGTQNRLTIYVPATRHPNSSMGYDCATRPELLKRDWLEFERRRNSPYRHLIKANRRAAPQHLFGGDVSIPHPAQQRRSSCRSPALCGAGRAAETQKLKTEADLLL